MAGSKEANLGGAAGATATESSIAEGSRISSLESNTDDLDELLTTLARATGQLMLMELSVEKVIEIVGPGAAWPNLDREDRKSTRLKLQSLMRIWYAVFCLKKKKKKMSQVNERYAYRYME